MSKHSIEDGIEKRTVCYRFRARELI